MSMARKPMDEDDPLVPKQISLPLSLRRKLRMASEETGKSEAQIVREALIEKLENDSANAA
jgi:predicted DNA-binding protein